MTVRMRHTRAHTANRRSHHALKEPALTRCPDCGAFQLRHMVCMACGRYRGKMVINMAEKVAKRQKRIAEKKRSLGQEKTKKDDDKFGHRHHGHEHEHGEEKPGGGKGFLPKILKPRIEGGSE